MSASLKLISLNIERSHHLERVKNFLVSKPLDVLCIQELYRRDVPFLEQIVGARALYVPMTTYVLETPPEPMGLGIFSRLPVARTESYVYAGNPDVLPELNQEDPSTWNNKILSVTFVEVEKDGTRFRLGNTHFTWTPDGEPNDLQRTNMKALLRVLESRGEFVLCGDFNAPRGKEIWRILAEKYKDNVPVDVTSTIDPQLHRAKGLRFVVDGIFSTPSYAVSDVELVEGVSDHKALVATIARR